MPFPYNPHTDPVDSLAIELRYYTHREEVANHIRNEIHMQIASQIPNLTKTFQEKNFVSPSVSEKSFPDQEFKFSETADFMQIYLRSIQHSILIALGWNYNQKIIINPDQTAENPDYMSKKFVIQIPDVNGDRTFEFPFSSNYFELDPIFKRLAEFIVMSYHNFFSAYVSVRIIANNDTETERMIMENNKFYSISIEVDDKTVNRLDRLAFEHFKSVQPEYIPTEN